MQILKIFGYLKTFAAPLTAAKYLKPQMLLMAFARGIAANVLHAAFLLPREYSDGRWASVKIRQRREAAGADVT